MKIKKVLLSTKKTALEYYKEQSDFLEDMLPTADLKEIRAGHNAHYATLDMIRSVLAERGIESSRSYMPYSEFEDFRGKDLIISIGGDGTVLNSSQYVLDDTPLLTVRSDRRSYGMLCEIDAEEFEETIDRILKDDFRTEGWTRAEGLFKERRLFALNEIYVGTRHSPSMARYEIRHGGASEWQMSSGVVVSTGTGSTGWYGNIPNSDGRFPRTSRDLKFIVREFNVAGKYGLTKGIVTPGQVLTIHSKMNVDGCVSFDGDYSKRMFDFNKGESIEIRAAETMLRVVKMR